MPPLRGLAARGAGMTPSMSGQTLTTSAPPALPASSQKRRQPSARTARRRRGTLAVPDPHHPKARSAALITTVLGERWACRHGLTPGRGELLDTPRQSCSAALPNAVRQQASEPDRDGSALEFEASYAPAVPNTATPTLHFRVPCNPKTKKTCPHRRCSAAAALSLSSSLSLFCLSVSV